MSSRFYADSVESAIKSSLERHKVLLIYLAHFEDTDSWEDERILNNPNTEIVNRITHTTVRLKLVEGTQGMLFFKQIFPQAAVPSCYLLLGSQVLDVITEDTSVDQFNEKLSSVLSKHDESPITASSTSALILASDTADSDLKVKAKQTRAHSKQPSELKREIKRPRMQFVKKEIGPLHENINDDKLFLEPEYTIQFKLFDGSVLRMKFSNTDTLSKVRDWIVTERTDYEMDHFCFYKPIDRITYSEVDETSKTLRELKLNRTMLILKPLEETSTSSQTGTLSWLRTGVSKLGSLLFGGGGAADGHEAEPSSNSAELASGESAEESATSNSSIRSPGSTRCSSPYPEGSRPALHFNSSTSQFSLNKPAGKLVTQPAGEEDAVPAERVKSPDEADRKTYNGNNSEIKDELGLDD